MKQETQFSFFPRLTTNQPSGLITLEELHRLVTTDAALKENTEKYRYFKAQGFDDDAAKIKRSRCPAFTPAVVLRGSRAYKNVEHFTGYSLVDIDKLSEAEVEQMLQRLKDDPYWLLVYVTLSGRGLDRPPAHHRPPLMEVKAYYHMLLQGERRKVGVSLIDREVIISLLLVGKRCQPNARYIKN